MNSYRPSLALSSLCNLSRFYNPDMTLLQKNIELGPSICHQRNGIEMELTRVESSFTVYTCEEKVTNTLYFGSKVVPSISIMQNATQLLDSMAYLLQSVTNRTIMDFHP